MPIDFEAYEREIGAALNNHQATLDRQNRQWQKFMEVLKADPDDLSAQEIPNIYNNYASILNDLAKVAAYDKFENAVRSELEREQSQLDKSSVNDILLKAKQKKIECSTTMAKAHETKLNSYRSDLDKLPNTTAGWQAKVQEWVNSNDVGPDFYGMSLDTFASSVASKVDTMRGILGIEKCNLEEMQSNTVNVENELIAAILNVDDVMGAEPRLPRSPTPGGDDNETFQPRPMSSQSQTQDHSDHARLTIYHVRNVETNGLLSLARKQFGVADIEIVSVKQLAHPFIKGDVVKGTENRNIVCFKLTEPIKVKTDNDGKNRTLSPEGNPDKALILEVPKENLPRLPNDKQYVGGKSYGLHLTGVAKRGEVKKTFGRNN